jgi:hypothetical protein
MIPFILNMRCNKAISLFYNSVLYQYFNKGSVPCIFSVPQVNHVIRVVCDTFKTYLTGLKVKNKNKNKLNYLFWM